MSAPGLDLQIIERINLPVNIFRTSINFMGCYAAIHGLKIADTICKSDKNAKVLVVCTELCTLHFQKENTIDNLTSSLLFGDGSAAMLVVPDENNLPGLKIRNFYSEVAFGGKDHMSWQLTSKGFLMSLSGYVPELIEQDFDNLLMKALKNAGIKKEEISHWCIHPGGKRILAAISKSAGIEPDKLASSFKVLNDFGNMSSPTILFVLKGILDSFEANRQEGVTIFGTAFGPGLTMETFLLSDQ
jgi:predicted naringenin-chalcone synthase